MFVIKSTETCPTWVKVSMYDHYKVVNGDTTTHFSVESVFDHDDKLAIIVKTGGQLIPTRYMFIVKASMFHDEAVGEEHIAMYRADPGKQEFDPVIGCSVRDIEKNFGLKFTDKTMRVRYARKAVAQPVEVGQVITRDRHTFKVVFIGTDGSLIFERDDGKTILVRNTDKDAVAAFGLTWISNK